MYLRTLDVQGFKCFGEPFTIELHDGLNVLVGENGAGKTGVVVPAGDVPAMAREIIGLATQREKARTMGLDGRKRVEQTFSMTAMVKQYQDLYDRCLKR